MFRVEVIHCTWFMLHENILEEGAEAEDGLGVGGDLVQPEPEPDRGWMDETSHQKTKNSFQLLRHLRYIALKVAYSCAGSGDT